MEQRRDSTPIPTRSEAYQKALFSALLASAISLMILKFFLGIAFAAAAVVAIASFIIFFGMSMRVTPRPRD
jgi:energy-converting hydrogenase Eha subunit C